MKPMRAIIFTLSLLGLVVCVGSCRWFGPDEQSSPGLLWVTRVNHCETNTLLGTTIANLFYKNNIISKGRLADGKPVLYSIDATTGAINWTWSDYINPVIDYGFTTNVRPIYDKYLRFVWNRRKYCIDLETGQTVYKHEGLTEEGHYAMNEGRAIARRF